MWLPDGSQDLGLALEGLRRAHLLLHFDAFQLQVMPRKFGLRVKACLHAPAHSRQALEFCEVWATLFQISLPPLQTSPAFKTGL